MKNYIVRLKPVDSFFFGGNITFGEKANYLVKSNRFPQQTAILGMIRKTLLIQEGLLKMTPTGEQITAGKEEDVDDLIGPESFDIKKPGQGFGKIRSISPVFLCRKEASKPPVWMMPTPKDQGFVFEKLPVRANLNTETAKPYIPTFKNYKPKDSLQCSVMDPSTCETFPLGAVFLPVEKIGIEKDPLGQTLKKAFYKQTSLRLEDGFEFAFIIKINVELKDTMVFLGADKSAFMLSAEESEKSLNDIFPSNPVSTRILFLSDVYVHPNIYDLCDFAFIHTVSFRNLQTKTGRYGLAKSLQYNLLERGSVLYAPSGKEPRGKIEDKLNTPHLKRIGYNTFIWI